MVLHVNGFLICPSLDEADRISHLIGEHIRLSRAEPGCLKFEAFRSHEDPTRFAVSEIYRDAAAFEAHKTRTRASIWWQETQDVKREFTQSED